MDRKMPSLSSNDPEELSLARFSYRMRKLYNAGTLPKENIKVLEGIPGWSWEIKKNIPIPPHDQPPSTLHLLYENETEVETAERISKMFHVNKLSPIYFIDMKNDISKEKLTLFREQYRSGSLAKVVENILRSITKPWSCFHPVYEDDIFHDDKFDDYLCYNKLPNDIHYRCYTASNLAKDWHTKYLKKKFDIIDSKIPGNIFDFEYKLFDKNFVNLLRDYFSGEQERRIVASLPNILAVGL